MRSRERFRAGGQTVSDAEAIDRALNECQKMSDVWQDRSDSSVSIAACHPALFDNLSLPTVLVSIRNQWNLPRRPASWTARASIARWRDWLRKSWRKTMVPAIYT